MKYIPVKNSFYTGNMYEVHSECCGCHGIYDAFFPLKNYSVFIFLLQSIYRKEMLWTFAKLNHKNNNPSHNQNHRKNLSFRKLLVKKDFSEYQYENIA